MTATFSEPRFHDDNAARQHLERIRWPNGPVCPHCGGTERNHRLTAKSARPGLLFCGDCRAQFSVTVGTVFERSKIPLHKWVLATHLLCSSKKGMSSHQLHRTLGVTYKTAWFMTHRIREAMRPTSLAPFGSNGGDVEVDETFIGKDPDKPKGKTARGYEHKNKVLALVDRATGEARTMVIDDISAKTIVPIIRENVAKEARVLTDEGAQYKKLRYHFAGHESTVHSAGEYVRLSDRSIHSNTVEGYFSIFKRGMKGVYQHCGKQHLHRYLAEFDFRYSNRVKLGIHDVERAEIALRGISGKRLTYRRIGSPQAH
jgi:transposase-like protein